MKRFIALARVSSREQEREGFSLDVQLDGFRKYAKKHKGTLDTKDIFVIAETATRSEERTVFRKTIAYAKRHHKDIDGVLFYKVDRAVRNLRDFVLLEDLESEYGVEVIFITQRSDDTPAGRMFRRQLATYAAFTTDQQSLDVREGIRKRVESGLFPSRAPYGYRNVRRNDRGLVETHPENSKKVKRIFELFAYQSLSVEEIIERLADEGICFTPSKPKFSTSKVYAILKDRSYLGQIRFHGRWFTGIHEPLIDSQTWDRVQVVLGKRVYRSHNILLGEQLIRCAFCGRAITPEYKEKKTKKGTKTYVYYHCTRYNEEGHPRIRIPERELEPHVLRFLHDLQVKSPSVKEWLIAAFRDRTGQQQRESTGRVTEAKRQLSRIAEQQKTLLDLRIASDIDAAEFEAKRKDLREREDALKLQIDQCAKEQQWVVESSSNAAEVFDLICEMWPKADNDVKRRILEIVFVNFTLDGEKLVPSKRTPFELLSAA